MVTRPENVDKLMCAALEGMHSVSEDTNGGEIISALLSLALRGVITARVQGVDPQILRDAVGRLMLECADSTKGN